VPKTEHQAELTSDHSVDVDAFVAWLKEAIMKLPGKRYAEENQDHEQYVEVPDRPE